MMLITLRKDLKFDRKYGGLWFRWGMGYIRGKQYIAKLQQDDTYKLKDIKTDRNVCSYGWEIAVSREMFSSMKPRYVDIKTLV